MDDLEFVQRCVKGEKPAWDEFVEKYSNLIYRYIHSVLRLKGFNLTNHDIVNDLFQEIFLLLSKDNFKKLKTYQARNGCSLASWLRQVVINYSIDYLRRLKPVVSLDEDSGDDLTLKDIIVDNSPLADDVLAVEDRLVHLTDCIQHLETEDKYFLRLYIDQGLSLKELEKILRVSRGSVDMRKARIVERLKDCFKSKGFFS
ncbi:MAG: sigma-70 family RNA polymerase sigma factor [Candidatus Omnitrophica bacterium]|jgi:RNA polymerase sigma factor (sigma-70 family)|nr:sigma-70 family RNA polymerase sigma factor [Candidatus Omnitrophota bacterium]